MTPMTPSLALRFPNASPASTSSPSTSGGAGIPRRARVFRRLDYPLWRATAHNPVRMLRLIPRETLEAAAARSGVPRSSTTARSRRSTRRAPRATPGGRTRFPQLGGQSIAYFSAEFALHQSLPIYAGGLGVLAGDHCKEASDLGVPLIGVGFMYPQGYFHQHISAEGWQEESYERLNWADAPIEPAIDARRQAVHHRGAARRSHRCSSRSGACASAASSCTCSTPTSRRTRRGIASCRRASTAAIARRASSRRSSSASAACARCKALGIDAGGRST